MDEVRGCDYCGGMLLEHERARYYEHRYREDCVRVLRDRTKALERAVRAEHARLYPLPWHRRDCDVCAALDELAPKVRN